MSTNLKCVDYLVAGDNADDRTKCIRDAMNYYWTEEDGICNERTEALEDAVDGLINLGYEPHRITGSLLSRCTDSMLVLRPDLISPVSDARRQEIINEYLPLDSRVERWVIADTDERVVVEESDSDDVPDEIGGDNTYLDPAAEEERIQNKIYDFCNQADAFEEAAEELYLKTQDKEILRIKGLTEISRDMASRGELTEKQLDLAIEEVAHNLRIFEACLGNDKLERKGPTFKTICAHRATDETGLIENDLRGITDIILEAFDLDDEFESGISLDDLTITIEYNANS